MTYRSLAISGMLRQSIFAGSLLTIAMSGALALGQTTPSPSPSSQSTSASATPDTPAVSAPAAAAPVWSVGPIDFSGLIDGYYDYNANHPSTTNNQLRNFDEKANQFSLNMAKLTASHDPDPVGFRLDLGFGQAFETIHAGEKNPQVFRNIEQAFVSVKPPRAKGFEADFGDFVTSAGAEVIETKDNWNYSRSLLFAWAIPYYHFGLRTSMPLSKSATAGFQLVNGWNNIEDNNSGKTYGVVGVLTKPKYTFNVNYYVGPEQANTNHGYRNLIDGTLGLTPTSAVSIYLNYDYAQQRSSTTNVLSHYQGLAGAARFQITKTIAFAPRAEIFNDPQGFSTGTNQLLNEITLTGEYKIAEGILSRVEYRRDHSDHQFFDRGNTPASAHDQSTLLAGVVAFFGPKR
ncbi:MAG: hypothetical protein JWP08_2695 [Bryobacterales bacterium]|nr:hypothetical protein [Bryobacterales bacterium]